MAVFLKSFVCFLRKKSFSRPPRINALESSLLGQLPVELILHITRFLEPASAASFSLCCQQISVIIGGTQYLKALQHEDRQSELYDFLTLLEPELPDHVLCYYCKKFHAIQNAKRYIYKYRSYYNVPGRPLPKCWEGCLDSESWKYFSPNFSWTVFQMAMKRYRQDRDYTWLLDLLSYHSTFSYDPGQVKTDATLARIVNGSLLVRNQRVFLPFREDDHTWYICPHKYSSDASAYIRNRMKHWDDPESDEAGLLQCEYCFTEFRVDFKAFEGQGIAMVLTKWHNIGRGLFPWDLEWRSHVLSVKPDGMRLLWERVQFEKGSISDAFEDGKEFEFASLLTSSWRKEWLSKTYGGNFYVT